MIFPTISIHAISRPPSNQYNIAYDVFDGELATDGKILSAIHSLYKTLPNQGSTIWKFAVPASHIFDVSGSRHNVPHVYVNEDAIPDIISTRKETRKIDSPQTPYLGIRFLTHKRDLLQLHCDILYFPSTPSPKTLLGT
jgi:hypothetical protein